ncbi:hypothetical protein WP50_33240, partial [Lactiplantibacillus plantarum]
AGGRYDGLGEQLSGRARPAVVVAMGLERLVVLVQAVNPESKAVPGVDIYLVASGADTQSAAMALADVSSISWAAKFSVCKVRISTPN